MTAWQMQTDAGPERGLEQYRTYGRFYERYWSRLFSMTQADMDRCGEQMRAQHTALDLTTLAKGVIRARLRRGPELNSGPAPDGSMPSQAVRLWDPGAMWHVGDRAIMALPATVSGRFYAPSVGEIRQVGDDHVIVQIDGVTTPQVYALGMQGSSYHRYRAHEVDAGQPSLASEIVSLADRNDETSQIDYVLWRFGASVVGRLLHALQADPAFVELEGLWYRVDLAQPLREAQLVALARAMFAGPGRPLTVPEVLALLPSEEGGGVAEQFGAMLSLQERPDLFTNVGSSSHPRWTLAGPPPVRLVATYSVYDPETYVVLCTPGESLTPQVAQRLWDAGLLRAALGDQEVPPPPEPAPDREQSTATGWTAHDHDAPVRPAPASAPDPRVSARADGAQRRSWPRWLPFGRRD